MNKEHHLGGEDGTPGSITVHYGTGLCRSSIIEDKEIERFEGAAGLMIRDDCGANSRQIRKLKGRT